MALHWLQQMSGCGTDAYMIVDRNRTNMSSRILFNILTFAQISSNQHIHTYKKYYKKYIVRNVQFHPKFH